MIMILIRKRSIRLLLAGVAIGTCAAADDPRPKPAVPQSGQPPVQAAPDYHTDRPEWAAMLADILQGSQLGPGEGWFKTAVSQTRFTWEATRANRDKDADGMISRAEWGGPDADFARLDRDHDGVLAAPDFDFSPHALTPSPGVQLFYRADRDGNGKVTREEFEGLFRALDGDGFGFVSQDELRNAFGPPLARTRPAPAGQAGPSRWTLVKGLFRQEIGSLQPGPRLDESAPDFGLRTVDGEEEITLSKLVGSKPVVLVFGNFTPMDEE